MDLYGLSRSGCAWEVTINERQDPLKVAFCPDGLSPGDGHKCISWPLKKQTFNPGSLCVPPMEAFLIVDGNC